MSRSSKEQIEVFYKALLAGALPEQAAQEAGIALQTGLKWCGYGAPISIDACPAQKPMIAALVEQLRAAK